MHWHTWCLREAHACYECMQIVGWFGAHDPVAMLQVSHYAWPCLGPPGGGGLLSLPTFYSSVRPPAIFVINRVGVRWLSPLKRTHPPCRGAKKEGTAPGVGHALVWAMFHHCRGSHFSDRTPGDQQTIPTRVPFSVPCTCLQNTTQHVWIQS